VSWDVTVAASSLDEATWTTGLVGLLNDARPADQAAITARQVRLTASSASVSSASSVSGRRLLGSASGSGGARRLQSEVVATSQVSLAAAGAVEFVRARLSALTPTQAEAELGHPVTAVEPATVSTSFISTSPPSAPPSAPPASTPSPPVDSSVDNSVPTVSTPNQNLQSSSDGGMSGGALAGIIIACLAAIFAAVCGYYYCKKRKGGKGPLASREVEALPVAVTSASTTTPRGSGAAAAQVAVTVESSDPVADHKTVKSRLREYEIAFEQREGRKPRKRTEWGEMWPEYERYAALRKMATQSKLAPLEAGMLSTRDLLGAAGQT